MDIKHILIALIVVVSLISVVGADWASWSQPWEFDYADSDYNFTIDLKEGWNMVSVPLNQSVSKYDFLVDYEGVYTWNYSVENGVLLDYVYGWDAENQYYEFVDVLEPSRGYWIWSYYDLLLRG